MVALMRYRRKPERRALGGQQVRANDVFKVHTPIKVFIRLHVVIRISFAHRLVVIRFGKKSRCSEHDAGNSLISMEQLAKILCRRLGHAVDVFRNRRNLLGYPCGRSPGGGTRASPKTLVVLVKTNDSTPLLTASSRRLSVAVMLVSTKSCRLWVAT